jgi:hypothetical protein
MSIVSLKCSPIDGNTPLIVRAATTSPLANVIAAFDSTSTGGGRPIVGAGSGGIINGDGAGGGDNEGDGKGVGIGVTDGSGTDADGDGTGVTDGSGVADGIGVRDGSGVTDGDDDGVGVTEGRGVTDGSGVIDGDGVAVGRSVTDGNRSTGLAHAITASKESSVKSVGKGERLGVGSGVSDRDRSICPDP